MAQATYPVLTWATRSLFKMIEPYLVLLRVEFTLQPTVTSGPVRSYRTLSPLPTEVGGLLSAALVVGSRRPAVSWHPAQWSPDFPPLTKVSDDCQGISAAESIKGDRI